MQPEVRLLTLTGTGGTGKTRLALAVAVEAQDGFADGAWLVNLAPLNDASLVLPTLAQTVGLKEQPEEPLLTSLARALRDWRALLVLDNFEQVVAAAPELVEVLAACTRLKVLVTSRTALRVYGEHQYVVPPLTVPQLAPVPQLEDLLEYESVALFVQRAQAAHAAFRPTEEDAGAIAEICSRLDGLPLAIELAAARIRLLPPQALLARLTRRLSLLTSRIQNVPERQQTLRRTIDWSYGLLDSSEQRLFRRIAVFAGGCTLEAAEAVCGDAPPAGRACDVAEQDGEEFIVEGFASLVDKSLLVRRDGRDGEPRFGMLETIHEYALELFESSPERDRLRDAHARFFLKLVEQAEPELVGPLQAGSFLRLDAERENLRAALGWTLDAGPSEVGVRIAAALFRYWDSRGQLAEGQRWLNRALAGAGEVGDQWRAKALNAAGNVARRRGEIQVARSALDQALALWRALDDMRGVAAALANLGNIDFDLGDYERAAAEYQESLNLYRRVADRVGMALALNNLGIAHREQGQVDAAVALHEESLALRRDVGDQGGIAQALDNLGRAALEHGDQQRALRLLREGLALSRELGDRSAWAMTLEDIGRALAMDGQLAQAARLWGAAGSMRDRFGTPMPAHRHKRHATAVEAARTQLGASPFDEAWEAGRTMSAEAAIEDALSEAQPGQAPAQHSLSPREQEVATLIARGLTSRQIAAALIVSEKTVDTHADHIRQKLGLNSRAQIAAWATSVGLTGRP
jgi:non-specific serine/threonine protein kinase